MFREHGAPEWFNWKCYQDMCAAVGHTLQTGEGVQPMFLISLDSDSRHGMLYHWLKMDDSNYDGPVPDRRDIPPGQPGHIPIDKQKNYVPLAKKVQDSMQFAIESIFASVKRAFSVIAGDRTNLTPAQMWECVQQAFRDGATPEIVQNCFRHGDENMRIFAATEETVVNIQGQDWKGTNGGWLYSVRRG